ncbi:hypothetical protein [Embleya scabrispora]|uniref:hypothetical protein n=1 Tax=Embleya scabrispora TaxID=159449 RepID=UPI0003817030|nr:hypothetical protein [Embleya scabrispora]MYS83002.1 hypothetical protein [Streptomyces sp. SID5474]
MPAQAAVGTARAARKRAVEVTLVNPATLPITVVTVEPDADGRVVGLRMVANPDKLGPVAGGVRHSL